MENGKAGGSNRRHLLIEGATLIAAAAGTWAAGRYFQKKIGGITGDCLGAANQFVELVCYLSLVVELPRATA